MNQTGVDTAVTEQSTTDHINIDSGGGGSNGGEGLADAIARRRTFAIISHPDAGKTTITEKLLLYGGAIRLAGSVKSRKAARHATSDWMEIEKQRGISVTSSVMQFEYDGYYINILDTPGHQDFSEDTYRTLMAADSAVMLIDGGKGVEAQTIKLFHVCRMRGIPIFTFVNKMDRASRDPFELMEEIENVLGIRSCPMNWPIGIDGDFQGVYDRERSAIELFSGGNHGQTAAQSTSVVSASGGARDPVFSDLLGSYYYDRLLSEIELLDIAGDPFDMRQVLSGNLTPLFFGSAMNNFGVEPFLKSFLTLAPPPSVKPAKAPAAEVDPASPAFTGFVFKIQANMNPAHRDRLAFVRICSGRFTRNMEVFHVNKGKKVRLSQPQQFMAQEHAIVEEAYPGDIIGLFDPGVFNIGDTLSERDASLLFEEIPSFSAEFFSRVSPKDSMKRKQFIKGLDQLSEEGAIQVFRQPDSGMETVIVGAVGTLQFEVLEYRLKSEYGVDLRMTTLPYRIARWIESGYDPGGARLNLTSTSLIVRDKGDAPVILFENEWSVSWAQDKNNGLALRETN
ncbi:MAG: peptide chain release factor 3 [Clostridiales bacterium]|jgi:peptide chain release factor 3|nr:peptide chain release factor 3 [Clostridiales bacterium]